jgi:Mg2+ and Co2+ transporter CorA
MNVPLPQFPGGEVAQFWWLFGLMLLVVITMLGLFRSRRWI